MFLTILLSALFGHGRTGTRPAWLRAILNITQEMCHMATDMTAAIEVLKADVSAQADVISSAKECPGDCIHVVQAARGGADEVEVAGPDAP